MVSAWLSTVRVPPWITLQKKNVLGVWQPGCDSVVAVKLPAGKSNIKVWLLPTIVIIIGPFAPETCHVPDSNVPVSKLISANAAVGKPKAASRAIVSPSFILLHFIVLP